MYVFYNNSNNNNNSLYCVYKSYRFHCSTAIRHLNFSHFIN